LLSARPLALPDAAPTRLDPEAGMVAPKLLLVALDAADTGLVLGWAREGHLPAIARILGSGFVARIATPPAVLESAVWPTYLTGATAASHGMFATVKLKVGTYDLEGAMYADRLPYPPFWTRLSQAGRRVAHGIAGRRSGHQLGSSRLVGVATVLVAPAVDRRPGAALW
jgi:hypothetical protein